MLENTDPPLPSGCLILVTGPSGAGKDSIISAAALALQHDGRFIFPKRIVTRGANPGEDHLSISADAFAQLRAAGSFALSWDAHGLSYAIPATIAIDLCAGHAVICNVSRAVVTTARDQFRRIYCIEITAPGEILRQRLIARGRESAAEIDARLSRTVGSTYKADIIIGNAASLEAVVVLFLAALHKAIA